MAEPVTIAQARLAMEDPHNCTDNNDILTVFDALFDGLVRRAADGSYRPALAESWTVSPDARHWTFHLRDGVTFHNGAPVTAEAVKYSIERMARPDMGVTLGAPGVYAQYLKGASVEITSPTIVSLTLAEPMADLLDILVYGYILPPDEVERAGDQFALNPVGTGPYKFDDHAPDEYIRARANSQYFGAAPPNETILWRKVDDRDNRLNALLSDRAHIATALDWSARDRLAAADDFTGLTYLSPTTYIYLLTATRGPCKDPRVRCALNLLLDRDALVENVLGGAGTPLTGFISPAHFGFDADASASGHAPEQAKALLAEAGFNDGLVLEINTPTSLPNEALALTAELTRQFKAHGIETNITVTEDRLAYAHQVRKKEIGDMCVFDSSPLSTYRVLREKLDARFAGSWWQGYHNAAVEDAIDRAARTPDDAARLAIYQDCYRLMQDDPPWLYLYNHMNLIGLKGKHPAPVIRPDGVLDVTALPRF